MKESTEGLKLQAKSFLAESGQVPLRASEIAAALKVRGAGHHLLRRALEELREEGSVTCGADRRWQLAGRAAPSAIEGVPVRGIFRVRINGTCWFMPDRGAEGALALNPREAEWVLHGDRVEAVADAVPASRHRMFEDAGAPAREEMRPGHVVRILERRRKRLVGVLRLFGENYAYVVPKDPLIRQNIRLEDAPAAMRPYAGRLVAIALQTPEEVREGHPVGGRFVADLGDPDDARIEVAAILQDHARSSQFPPAVEAEAAAIRAGQAARRGEHAPSRRDLRDRCVLTIDPADARDYDDAVSIAARAEGGWHLGVHIADVAAFVVPGGAIDAEACERGNSAYLVDRVIRMLPEELTVRTCSLQPREDHLTHTVEIDFDAEARPVAVRTFRSVIRSRACLSYGQVEAFFGGQALPAAADSPEIRASLTALRALAGRLRARRFAEGALDFALPEVRCVLDADGEPVRFVKRGAAESYALIEECMLAANRAVAEKLYAANWPCVYRIHDEPEPEQWARMEGELRALGVTLRSREPAELNRIAREAIGTPGQYMITLTLLRNLQRATYTSVAAPHFGLGFAHYAHFTSPIRRYPDLVVHRLLGALEEGRKCPYSKADIDAMALHCADREREAAEMEMQSLQVKRIRYYANMLRRGDRTAMAGTIVSLNPKGLVVELADSLQQGLLPYAAMGKERYTLAPDDYVATSARGTAYRLGQPLSVVLAAVDVDKRRVDFGLPSALGGGRRDRPSASRKQAGKPAPGKGAQRKRARRHR
ncbi:MAG: VacB/RNase II family 3'-5' exoribonuclease [Kiritimatiellae bacterium]|nr:VacB/RNase II family 3'-5' exoribonuclease [Kiritimatiellia bacterium]